MINKVAFKILGLVLGSISLRGTFKSMDTPTKLLTPNNDTVKVYFDPPRINVGSTSFELGGYSSVVLATTYLDEKVRIGKGSRGSYFVFTRGGPSDTAQMDTVGTQPPSAIAKYIGAAILAGLYYGAYQLVRSSLATSNWVTGIAGGLLSLLCLGLTYVSWRGGAQRDEDEEVRRQMAMDAAPGARHPDLQKPDV